MLKKRILASSLASVMALSSVSVVAFADETTTAAYGETVTKAELKEYVASFDAFVKDELADYGTVQSQQFRDALKYAKSVADTKNPDNEDVIAAYQMLKNVRESMGIYDADDLKALVSECKEDNDTKNIMNALFQDKIWDPATFAPFTKAYREASSYTGTDTRATTNYYTNLKIAHDNLKELESVTKTEFRAVYTDFMNIASKFKNFESWRRGVCTVDASTGTADEASKFLTSARFVTFAELQEIVYGTSASNVIGSDGKTPIGITTEKWINVGDKLNVKAFVEFEYNHFAGNDTSSETTHPNVLAAYKAAKDAVAVFNGWQADGTDNGSIYEINSLFIKYQNDLVKTFANNNNSKSFVYDVLQGSSISLGSTATTALFEYDANNDKFKVKSDIPANDAKLTDAGKMVIDTYTGKFAVDATTNYKYDATANPTSNTRYAYLATYLGASLEPGQDLTEFVPVTADMIVSGDNTSPVPEIAKAIKAVQEYQKVVWDVEPENQEEAFKIAFGSTAATSTAPASVQKINPANVKGIMVENDSIAKGTGSPDEYEIIARYLQYALESKFPAAAAQKTKDDVVALLSDSIDLINATGESSKFDTNNSNLAKAYNAVLEWVAAANAKADYKDGTKVKYTATAADAVVIAAATASSTGYDADTVYAALHAKYKVLADEFAQYPYSYDEIVETIAEAADGIDDGVYGASVKDLVTEITVSLSTIKASTGCEVFTTKDRKFNGFNRTNSKGTQAEKDLIADYEALIKAMEETATEDVVKGDADGDGKVTINDALRALKASVGSVTLSESEKKGADVDGVPGVTALDALAILKMALKIG